MNKKEVFGQAMGLRRTAENLIRAGQGSQAVSSIVVSATRILIGQACSANGHNPTIQSLTVNPDMTWTEILAIADTVCRFASQTQQRKHLGAACSSD